MVLYNMIGCRRRHDVSDTVPLLVLKLFSGFIFSSYDRFFNKFWVEMNVNISNELIFSDVYRTINYIVPLAKFT